VHRVDEHQGSLRVRKPRAAAHVGYRPERVGRGTDAQQLASRRDRLLQVGPVEDARAGSIRTVLMTMPAFAASRVHGATLP
jgi:hypothetical protein